ncbi:MAG TPA: helix-turn-helix domain-containing protein [Ktedonobacterales bacterium]
MDERNRDERPEVYNLESIEQVRAMADELRIRIVDLVSQQPMTVTQLGEALGVAPGKVHYHVRELERVGLMKLAFTREKSGILEKYYTTIAKKVHVPSSLLQHAPPDEVLGTINEYAQATISGFMRAASYVLRTRPDALNDPSTRLSLGGSSLWLSGGDFEQFTKDLQALVDKYGQRRGVEGEREVVFFELVYDARLVDEAAQRTGAVAPAPAAAPRPPALPNIPQIPQIPVPPNIPSIVETRKGGRVMAAGAVTFSRDDLERVVARGERLDIRALGFCTFDDDIPPELADRAIARFRYRGILTASPALREVLKRKEGAK